MRSACVLLLLITAQAGAAQVDGVRVEHDSGRYAIRMQARLDAAPQAAFAAFTDYARLPQINDAIENVRLLSGAPAGATRLHSRVRICVTFFCRRLTQIQDLRTASGKDSYTLEAIVLRDSGDLRSGHAQWRMSACGRQTCLEFRAELEPDFWVPPLLGPWLIERKLQQEAVVTARGIEHLAHDYLH